MGATEPGVSPGSDNDDWYIYVGEVMYPYGTDPDAPAVIHGVVTQTGGAPDRNPSNNEREIAFDVRRTRGDFVVNLTYDIDSNEELVATLVVRVIGTEPAHEVSVALPGVPVPLVLPEGCSGT